MHTFATPYTYEEYPKWVRTPDGRDVIVQSADEEAQTIGVQASTPRRGRPRKAPVTEDAES